MIHPLTDEMCTEIQMKFHACPDNWHYEDMRAAADWQLEQVIEYLENNLEFALDWSDTFIDRFKKAMRPQEDKPMTDDMKSVANKAITEARAMLDSLVSDGSIDRQTYYDFIGEFEETMLPEEDN